MLNSLSLYQQRYSGNLHSFPLSLFQHRYSANLHSFSGKTKERIYPFLSVLFQYFWRVMFFSSLLLPFSTVRTFPLHMFQLLFGINYSNTDKVKPSFTLVAHNPGTNISWFFCRLLPCNLHYSR